MAMPESADPVALVAEALEAQATEASRAARVVWDSAARAESPISEAMPAAAVCTTPLAPPSK